MPIQHELSEAVLTAGDRVILVVLSGRPYAVGELTDRATASLQVFFPGQAGAAAVAGVLSGRLDPSGRLPVQVPGAEASQPGTYLGPKLAQPSQGVSNQDPTPAFPFGHGLAYTDFEIEPITAVSSSVRTDGLIEVDVVVRNVGSRAGTMVPQLYLTDPVASITRPVRQLVGFARLHLEAGASERLCAVVPADLASFTDARMERVVEPGALTVTVAQSAADPGRSLDIELVGSRRVVDHTRALSSTFVPAPQLAGHHAR